MNKLERSKYNLGQTNIWSFSTEYSQEMLFSFIYFFVVLSVYFYLHLRFMLTKDCLGKQKFETTVICVWQEGNW